MHVLGIRSRTRVTDRVLSEAHRLLTLGAFCIGTNQVALEAASQRGVPVFNAPFSNTRSVAELVIAEIIALARRLADRSREMHEGRWRKGAPSSVEVRGKTLGIVGYGHIGTQVGVLAEAVGMQVLFHDIVPKLPMGNNRPAESLEAVLAQADFVTLHVPETPLTRGLIGESELAPDEARGLPPEPQPGQRRRGGCAREGAPLRPSRGCGGRRLPGGARRQHRRLRDRAARGPERHPDPARRGLDRGGAGSDRARGRDRPRQVRQHGGHDGLGELPPVEPPPLRDRHRLLNVHRNVPGVLSSINKIVSEAQANIESQILATTPAIGYLVMDLNREVSREVRLQMSALATSIRTRVLY